jgi:hypothetical protein
VCRVFVLVFVQHHHPSPSFRIRTSHGPHIRVKPYYSEVILHDFTLIDAFRTSMFVSRTRISTHRTFQTLSTASHAVVSLGYSR